LATFFWDHTAYSLGQIEPKMQVGTLNLLIAAQQARDTQVKRADAAKAPVATATDQTDAFSPLAFKTKPETIPQGAGSGAAAPSAFDAATPLGSQIDIRV
jgi:hypothetical protein